MTALCRNRRHDPCTTQCHACAQRERFGADAPGPCADPIVESVVAELRARSVVGVRKYGVTLEGLSHRAALRHAFEEALDHANYLMVAMARLDGESK